LSRGQEESRKARRVPSQKLGRKPPAGLKNDKKGKVEEGEKREMKKWREK